MRVLTYCVTEKDAGRTVKSLALREMKLSRSQFSSLKFKGGITADGRIVHADEHLPEGAVLRAELWDEAAPIAAYDLPISLVYRDEDLIIADKPAPLPTLSSAHQTGPTLENVLYAHLGKPENYIFRPVNRLDKGTSGLMAIACNAHAQQLLQKQLHTDSFVREYLAVCKGKMPASQGIIDLPIGKAGEGARREVRPDGARAVTYYWVEEEKNGKTLVRLRLETGRTHQIRVHLSHMGCPIIGDYLYGMEEASLGGRFALHAFRIGLNHPVTNVKILYESPLPGELRALLD